MPFHSELLSAEPIEATGLCYTIKALYRIEQ